MNSLANPLQRVAQGAIILAGVVGAGLIWSGRLAVPWSTSSAAARASADGGNAFHPAPSIFAGGVVEGMDRELALRFEVAGRVKKLHVREGATVKAGQVLAELETDVAELQVREAQLRRQLALAQRNRYRGQTQRGTGDATRASYVVPEAPSVPNEETIEGDVALAETVARREQLMLEKCTLRAPFDGVVLQATAQVGELVAPTGEPPTFLLADCRRTRVRAFVEELDASRVRPGQSAVVRLVGRAEPTYAATVVSCSPFVHPKSHRHLRPGERLDVRMREVVVELQRGSDLLIGLPVEVHIDPQS